MKKIIYIKTLTVLLASMTLISCDQDVSIPDIPRFNSTTAEVIEESIVVSEGNSTVFTIQQEDLIEEKIDAQEFFDYVSGQIGIRVIGGTATPGVDYIFNIPTIQNVSPFLLQDGYYYGYDASVSLQEVVNGVITIVNDGVSESNETIELEFFPVGLASVVINDTMIITITD